MTDNPPVGDQDASIFDLLEDPTSAAAPAVKRTVTDEGKKRRRKVLAIILAVALVLTGVVFAWYLTTRKPLTELPGVISSKVPTYKTAIYDLAKTQGVAVSPDGERIYVSVSGAKPAAFAYDRDGKQLAQLKPPADSGAIHVPVYLAVSPDGTRVYVGDRAAGAVYVYDRDGAYVSTFTPKDTTLKISPLGVAVSADGSVYVANVASDQAADHCVLVFAADGTLKQTLGKGQLNFPNQIVLDAAGDVFVTDSNDGRLAVIEPSDKTTTLIEHGVGAGDLGLPRGLGIDDQGRIFVVDTTDHMVRMYTKGATPTALPTYVGSFGDQGIADGKFQYPNGLAVDARGRIYVTDRDNNRLQVWGF